MADEAGEVRAGTPKLFVAAILAGSFLLFLVQPMVARMALPKLGGAPAVWNSAMLVYQALLLGGYAYAHWLGRVPPRMQAIIHLCVLAVAALWLPIGLFAMELPADAQPAIWVPWLFGASIGPLFFAIAAQAPLLQRWYSVATHGRDPYQLYAASNIGSFGGLLAYPLLVEPNMAITSQRWLWTGGYALVFVAVAACALMLPRKTEGEPHVAHTSPAPGRRQIWHWILLAFVPSGLMLATTTFLTTDIVAVPLLWVVPLGLYLLSFSIAFSDSRLLAELVGKVTPLVLLLFGATLIAGGKDHPYFIAAIGLILLFTVSVALHSRMYALRPAPDRLTGFYLAMSVGGALGGVFSGLIAPIVFDWTYEYPLLILAAGLLVPQIFLFPFVARLWRGEQEWVRIKALAVTLAVAALVLIGLDQHFAWMGEKQPNYAFMAVAALGLLSIGNRLAFMVSLAGAIFLFGGYHSIELSLHGARTRSYFGVYTVTETATQHVLTHGTTIHGVQWLGGNSRFPTSYYVPRSGIGQAMLAAPALYGPNARIGVVGLGSGTLSCYAHPGQSWRIYEIDPAVVSIARDSGKFTFLSQCLPHPDIVIGDARLRLAEEPNARFDLLALDAFSSDAVPMHLMTKEAFQTYARVVAPSGLLMVHISNRYLDLAPVVASAAEQGGWYAAELPYRPDVCTLPDGSLAYCSDVKQGTPSDWIALTRDKTVYDRLMAGNVNWHALAIKPGFTGWTDDFASIVPVLRPIF
jgi:spermidine synthase